MVTKIVRQFYLLTAIHKAAIGSISAMYVMFLLSKGLNLFEVNIVNAVFFITLFVFEIPTGAFADIFGRKTSFIASCLLFGASMFLYGVSESFWWFVFAEIIGAIGSTFATGAFDAWFVDEMRHNGYKGPFQKFFARKQVITHGAVLVSALLGAWLADTSLVLPWFLGGITFVITAVAAYFIMKEEHFVRQKFSFVQGYRILKETVSSSIRYGMNNRNIRFIMVLTAALSLCVMAPNMQWQPLFSDAVGSQTMLGVLKAGITFSLLLGSVLAVHFLEGVGNEQKALLIIHGIAGIGIIASVCSTVLPVALVAFLLHEVARGAIEPINNAYMHDNVPTKERATIVSFSSIAHHVGGAVGLLISGALAEYGSISVTWIVSGGSLFLISILLWRRHL